MQAIKLSGLLRVTMLALFLFISSFSFGQQQQRAPLKQIALADYKAENEGWLVNINEAYEISKKTGKPILANFTGSDWCGWCKRLTASVFSHDEFKDWAEKNVVLLELDFPRKVLLPPTIVNQNKSLQRAFQVRGYPTIHVFDLEKNENGEFAISAFGKTGYARTVKQFTDGVDAMITRRDSGE